MFFILIVAILLSTLIFCWKYQTRGTLPPGPIRWPIIGSIPQLLSEDKEYPHLQIEGLRRKYGDIMSVGLGVHFTVVISSFEHMENLFKLPETTVERFHFPFVDQRTNSQNLGILFSYGDTWKTIRNFTVKTLREFGFGKFRSMDESVEEEMASLISDIQLQCNSNDGVWLVNSTRFGVFSLNVVWGSVGGYRFEPGSTYVKKHIELNSEIATVLSPTNLVNVFPFLKYFPKISGYEEHGRIHAKCAEFTRQLIQDARQKRGERIEAHSFVEVFLDQIEKNKSNHGTLYTENQLVTVLMDLFLASAETSSVIMCWLVLYLVLYQKIQTKIREEIVKAKNRGVDSILLAARNEMPYLRAFVLETLRCTPYGPLPPPRRVTEDIEYGEYTIPKGTCLQYNLYAIFQDSVFWGDPEEFRPERFFDKSGTSLDPEKLKRLPVFGVGKRNCPGESLAMDTLLSFVFSLISTFSLHPVQGKEPTLEPLKSAMTIRPKPFLVSVKSL